MLTDLANPSGMGMGMATLPPPPDTSVMLPLATMLLVDTFVITAQFESSCITGTLSRAFPISIRWFDVLGCSSKSPEFSPEKNELLADEIRNTACIF